MDSEKSKFILLRRPYIYYSAGILLAILFTAQCAAMIPLYQLALFPFDLEDPNRWFWHAVINSWYYINCGFLYIFSTTFALSVMKRFIQWKSWMKVCLFLLLLAFAFAFVLFVCLFVCFVLFCLSCLFPFFGLFRSTLGSSSPSSSSSLLRPFGSSPATMLFTMTTP